MADPVIMDDGGSTRIRQAGDGHRLDKLLTDHKEKADGSWTSLHPPALQVLYLDRQGVMHALPKVPLAHNDQVTVTSENAQQVDVRIQLNDSSRLEVHFELVAGAEPPIIEARQVTPQQRRYVVVNAGSIKSVTMPGAAAPIFDAVTAKSEHTMLMFG